MTALPVAPKPPRPPKITRLRRGDHEFLPAALEILETPLSPIRSSLIMSICAFVGVALLWSYIGRVDIIAAAQGKIQPVGRTKTIQPLEPGRVAALSVENGHKVHAGDVLIQIDPSEAQADESNLSTNLRSFRAETQRRNVAIFTASKRVPGIAPQISWSADTPPEIVQREQRVLAGDLGQLYSTVASLEAQQKSKMAERTRLVGTIAAQETLIQTLKERVDMRVTLFDRNAESKASVIDAREVYQTQMATLASEKGQLGQIEADIQVAQRDIEKTYNAFFAENAQKMAEAERQADDAAQKLEKARIKTSHMILKSPIDGTVQGLTVTTVGQVVSSGEQIMQIVPEGAAIEIESYMPNGDIGFIKAGQSAIIKVESFPFTEYGTIDAKVTRVARDAIPQPEAEQHEENPVQSAKASMFGGAQRTQNLVYPVTLALDKTTIEVDGTIVPLVPGMAVTVEVKTGTRRILGYVFSPLLQVVSTAMKER